MQIAPDDASAHRFRGFTFIAKNEWDKAIADYTIVIQKNPNLTAAYERRAVAYRNLKKNKEAIADYSKVISLDSGDTDGYRQRAYLYSIMGENEKAAADYRAILKAKPDDADTQTRLKALEAKAAGTPAPAAKSARYWFVPHSVAAIKLSVL